MSPHPTCLLLSTLQPILSPPLSPLRHPCPLHSLSCICRCPEVWFAVLIFLVLRTSSYLLVSILSQWITDEATKVSSLRVWGCSRVLGAQDHPGHFASHLGIRCPHCSLSPGERGQEFWWCLVVTTPGHPSHLFAPLTYQLTQQSSCLLLAERPGSTTK